MGATLGLVTVTAVGAVVGAALAVYLTAWMKAIRIGGGLLFIAFGIGAYLRKENADL